MQFSTNLVRSAVLLAGVCGLLASSPAAAESKDGKFAVEGPGQASCARILRAKDTNALEYARYLGFMEGYISAANRYEPNTFDLTPWHTSQALTLILTTHCKSHPKDILGVVMQEFVGAMMPLRLASYSAREKIGDDRNHTEVYEAIVKRSQEALARKGLYHGLADGKFSPAMGDALREFQKTARLDPTGIPDTATLWVLLNP
jgi:hypothetical protein